MATSNERRHSLGTPARIIEKKLVPATVFHELENKDFFLKGNSLDQIKKWKKAALDEKDSTKEEHSNHSTLGKADHLRGEGIPETGDNIRDRLVANTGLRNPLRIPETYIVNNPADEDGQEDNAVLDEATRKHSFIQNQSSYIPSHASGKPEVPKSHDSHSTQYKPHVRKIYQAKANHLLKCLEGHGTLITWNDYGRISVAGNVLDITWDQIIPALFNKRSSSEPVPNKDINKVLEVICHLKCEDIITNPQLCQSQKFSWFYLNY